MNGDSLQSLIEQVFSSGAADRLDPAFRRECEPLRNELAARRHFSFRRYLVQLAGIEPERKMAALDAGCGFGANCLCFYVMGFRRIHAFDLNEAPIRALKAYLPALGVDHVIFPQQGDATELTIHYPPNYFDLVLTNEALSRFHDPAAFLREAFTVLKPGGAMLITETHNASNPLIRWRNQRLWAAWEHGPLPEKSADGAPAASPLLPPAPPEAAPAAPPPPGPEKPLLELRREILRESFPQLKEEEIEELAKGACRMNRRQIIEAGRVYVGSQKHPIEPNTNEALDNMFSPRALAREMREIGFEARAYGYFGGATRGGLVFQFNRLWQAVSPLTIPFSRVFFIVGRKPL